MRIPRLMVSCMKTSVWACFTRINHVIICRCFLNSWKSLTCSEPSSFEGTCRFSVTFWWCCIWPIIRKGFVYSGHASALDGTVFLLIGSSEGSNINVSWFGPNLLVLQVACENIWLGLLSQQDQRRITWSSNIIFEVGESTRYEGFPWLPSRRVFNCQRIPRTFHI